jgi:hypothetical protein
MQISIQKSPLLPGAFLNGTSRSGLQKYFGRQMSIQGGQQGRRTKI